VTDEIAQRISNAAPLTFEDAANAGYRVHRGAGEDGALSGMFWWTLFRSGWAEPEVSSEEWPSSTEAEDAAVAALAAEVAAGDLIV
jgi:hypothetical protein